MEKSDIEEIRYILNDFWITHLGTTDVIEVSNSYLIYDIITILNKKGYDLKLIKKE